MDKFESFIQNRSPRYFILGALFWALAVAELDYFTGYHIRVAPLYLPSVFLIAWFADLRPGIWMCLGITILWFSANYLAGQRYQHLFTPIWNIAVRFFAYIAFFLAVTLFRRERQYSLQDPLTAVANRRAITAYAAREIQRCRRNQKPFTVAFMDCDNFKKLNDRWGHGTGDSFLRYIAKAAAAHVRGTDMVARLGGDEFIVLLPETTASDARTICQGLKERLDEGLKSASCPATVSMGVVTFSPVPQTLDAMLKPADQLMYRVKETGKDHIEFLTL